MPYDRNADEIDDELPEEPKKSFFAKFRETFMRNGDDDDSMYEDDLPQTGHAHHPAGETATVARVPAPHRSAGGSLNPVRRSSSIAQMRLEHERATTVTVRRSLQSFEDVRRAVDGLREGVQQIVNIEQTPADIAERLIDFLNGATCALDGSVEKIGNQVYLFTPSTITIDVEDKSRVTSTTKPFFDRE